MFRVQVTYGCHGYMTEMAVKLSINSFSYLLSSFSERHADKSVRHRFGVDDVFKTVQIVLQPASVRLFTPFAQPQWLAILQYPICFTQAVFSHLYSVQNSVYIYEKKKSNQYMKNAEKYICVRRLIPYTIYFINVLTYNFLFIFVRESKWLTV